MTGSRLIASLTSLFALAATALAIIGLFAMIIYTSAQRAREIGIRMAVGAGRVKIFEMVLTAALKLISLGITVGILISAAFSRMVGSLLFEVDPLDWMTYLAASLLLMIIAAIERDTAAKSWDRAPSECARPCRRLGSAGHACANHPPAWPGEPGLGHGPSPPREPFLQWSNRHRGRARGAGVRARFFCHAGTRKARQVNDISLGVRS